MKLLTQIPPWKLAKEESFVEILCHEVHIVDEILMSVPDCDDSRVCKHEGDNRFWVIVRSG